MRYTTRLMRLCLLISVLIAAVGFLIFGRSITVYIPLLAPVQSAEALHLQWDEGHMQILHKELKGDYLQLRVAAEEPGSHWLSITDSSGQIDSIYGFRVASGGLIYDKVCGSFSGCTPFPQRFSSSAFLRAGAVPQLFSGAGHADLFLPLYPEIRHGDLSLHLRA